VYPPKSTFLNYCVEVIEEADYRPMYTAGDIACSTRLERLQLFRRGHEVTLCSYHQSAGLVHEGLGEEPGLFREYPSD